MVLRQLAYFHTSVLIRIPTVWWCKRVGSIVLSIEVRCITLHRNLVGVSCLRASTTGYLLQSNPTHHLRYDSKKISAVCIPSTNALWIQMGATLLELNPKGLIM